MPQSPVCPASHAFSASRPTHTVPDCTLDGQCIALDAWSRLSSDELARVVGLQTPASVLENAQRWSWSYVELPLETLRTATEDQVEPDGGWAAAYQRHRQADAQAVAGGSPAYAGRDVWLQNVWVPCPAVYPLFVVLEPAREDEDRPHDGHRLLDGYHRLAGAFHHGLNRVPVLLGVPR